MHMVHCITGWQDRSLNDIIILFHRDLVYEAEYVT